MKKIILAALFYSFPSMASDNSQNETYYVNESVKICKEPSETVHLPDVNGQPYFLKYTKKESSETYLTIVIWGRDIPRLEINPYTYFSSGTVCVSGTVSSFRGRKQIIVRNTDQLTRK